MRPVGVKAFEYALQRVWTNAGPVVVDHDLDFGSHAPAHDAHPAAGIGKRLRVGQEVGDHLAEPRIVARHREGVGRATAFEPHVDADIVAEPGFVRDRCQRGQQAADIDRRHVLALQFGVEPAGIGNVGDQAIEPADVVLDHLEQPRRLFSFFASGRVSTAERSEVRGFFSSWETSAAKVSIASMRL